MNNVALKETQRECVLYAGPVLFAIKLCFVFALQSSYPQNTYLTPEVMQEFCTAVRALVDVFLAFGPIDAGPGLR